MTIPASNVVTINPGVIGAGGNPLSLNGVIMSQSGYLPSAGAQPFASADAVSDYFGPASDEYALALTYFSGYDNSALKPGTLYFAPYAAADRAAFNQSGSLADMSLADLQGLGTGTLIVTVDGGVETSGNIELGAIASFSAAATAIAAGFAGAPLACTWDAVNSTFRLTSVTTGAASTIGYATGTLSTGLKFTAATGAILSQGVDASTPATAMNSVKAATLNWAAFMTIWEPDTATKELFADWVQTQNQRFMYVAWDTDAQAIVNGSLVSFGAIVKALDTNGVVAVYNTVELAAFLLGLAASIDFAQTNGRVTTAFKGQSGFTPTVTDEQIAANLIENGYSFYGQYATSTEQFNFFFNGQIAGEWLWIDSYINQIQLNAALQQANMELLTSVTSIPYTQAGYNMVRASMNVPIAVALNFGSIRPGVTLSASQISQVTAAAGIVQAAQSIQQQGYYLQILDPGATARAQRGSPIINLWYTDGGAIQQITVASTAII
jgi:hypothetical protein